MTLALLTALSISTAVAEPPVTEIDFEEVEDDKKDKSAQVNFRRNSVVLEFA